MKQKTEILPIDKDLHRLFMLQSQNPYISQESREEFARLCIDYYIYLTEEKVEQECKEFCSKNNLTYVYPKTIEDVEKVVRQIVNNNSSKVSEYKSGKDKLYGLFVGQVIKATGGIYPNMEEVENILRNYLNA